MKKTLILFIALLFLFNWVSYWSRTCSGFQNCKSLSEQWCIDIDPHNLPSMSTSVLKKYANLYTTTYVCPWDSEYNYYNSDKYTIEEWLPKYFEKTPSNIDNYCNQFENDFSKEKCKEAVEEAKTTDEYKDALEKYEKEQEYITKQKELEEKQAEIEAKQKEIEETQEKIKEQQEKNEKIEESTYQIVEELTKENTVERVMSEEVKKAKEWLWVKAAIFDSLVPLFNKKDKKIQDNVRVLLKTFTQSNDEYTRNIGIYFWYLVE